jgi:hypothetical protein
MLVCHSGDQLQEFSDSVNRNQFRKCVFTSRGQFIVAATAEKSEHDLRIWSIMGTFVKQLQGPKQGIFDIAVSFHLS